MSALPSAPPSHDRLRGHVRAGRFARRASRRWVSTATMGCLLGALVGFGAVGCVIVEREPPRAQVSTPPPVAPVEPPLTCGPNATRIAGQWRWNGYQYVWVPQRCDSRPGYRYQAGGWRPCGDGYCFQEGAWIRIEGGISVGP